ncbi:MAG: TRAP transporter small permease subunit [Rhodobacteraceae bacterium]|nr:TRAP transporter small permease subunit [Paracoccaceae bacterium]
MITLVLRWLEYGRRLVEAVATLAFAGMVGLFGWTIWQRFVVGLPSRWSDEVTALIFLWVVFGAAALVIPYREHIAVGLVYDTVSPGMRRWMEALGTGIAAAILLAALPATLDYIAFLWRERTPALMWPLNRAYAVFGLFQAMIGLRLAIRCIAALAGRPMEA